MSHSAHIENEEALAALLKSNPHLGVKGAKRALQATSAKEATRTPTPPVDASGDSQRKESDGYDSELERDFATMMDFVGTPVVREPVSIRLVRHGKGWRRYEPDFMGKKDGGLTFYELKPNFVKREARVGELKLDLAAEWCLRWGIKLYRVTRVNGQWFFEERA